MDVCSSRGVDLSISLQADSLREQVGFDVRIRIQTDSCGFYKAWDFPFIFREKYTNKTKIYDFVHDNEIEKEHKEEETDGE